jgi:hypothetical protein
MAYWGTGLTTLGILLLIATDRDLWSPEDPTAHLRWKGLPDAYSIPLIEQLWYVIDRATRLVGLRTMFGSLYWQWNYGSAALHLLEWLWLMGVALLWAALTRLVSGWLGRRWQFLLDRRAMGYAAAQGWLVVYLSAPLVEWALHGWITIGWQRQLGNPISPPAQRIDQPFTWNGAYGYEYIPSQGCTMSALASMTPALHGGCNETPSV